MVKVCSGYRNSIEYPYCNSTIVNHQQLLLVVTYWCIIVWVFSKIIRIVNVQSWVEHCYAEIRVSVKRHSAVSNYNLMMHSLVWVVTFTPGEHAGKNKLQNGFPKVTKLENKLCQWEGQQCQHEWVPKKYLYGMHPELLSWFENPFRH